MGADLGAGQGQTGRRRGELHAAARTTAAACSTTRNGRLPLLRLQNLGNHAPPA